MKTQLISLGEEASRLIKPLVESRNFSQWVEDRILKELKDEATLKQEIELINKSLKEKQEQIKLITEFNKNLNEDIKTAKEKHLSPMELKFWKNCIFILENRGREYADGQRLVYNNEFVENINKFEFLKLYEQMLLKLGVQTQQPQ